ncbi:MAG TPA: SctK family type III secretion system sorting platform protein [Geminicoccaceae bacterium]|nr:SctK family type III secretion system sorting platform protein [Geminicoccaceae bacterium]
MPPDAARSLLRADRAMFEAAFRFNYRPLAYADPTRVAALASELPPSVWQRLRATPRVAGRLSRLLLEQHGLAGEAWWDFTAPLRRLALLDGAELLRLARYAGALLHTEAIRRVIGREVLLLLRRQLGEEGYAFALKRAPFIAVAPARPAPTDLPAAIDRDGQSCLAAWLGAEPRAVAERVRLKFPPAGALDAPEPALAGEAGKKVLAKVLREGDPAWRAYCG